MIEQKSEPVRVKSDIQIVMDRIIQVNDILQKAIDVQGNLCKLVEKMEERQRVMEHDINDLKHKY